MDIYCCTCAVKVSARLTDGSEVYPYRPDLSDLPFWKCDTCGNFVGCHHKTTNRTRPLGYIAFPELRKRRSGIHDVINKIVREGVMTKRELYRYLSSKLGRSYHTGEIKSLEDVKRIVGLLRDKQEGK